MLQHADPDEAILIKFCLSSGFRDREIRYVTWRDIDFRNSRGARYRQTDLELQTEKLRRKSRTPACGHD